MSRAVGSVIIPAHNEARVIARTLSALAPMAATGMLEVIVVCNGCSDGTAEVARSFDGVRVLDSAQPSKPFALNLGDEAAQHWPRLYLDADIEITTGTVADVLAHLSAGRSLAARPAREFDDTGASWPVQAFYRTKRRMPSLDRHLWGAGVYAVSLEGRSRFEEFPDTTGDDLWIDCLYASAEKAIVATTPVRVRTPRTVRSLLSILRRVYRGNAEFPRSAVPSHGDAGPTTSQTARELLRTVNGVGPALDAATYATLVLLARLIARRRTVRWERDESSRP
ncbi:glycosyltransferase family A protein [Georgenia yuyongxinii]|uniref:glycosyltransferase family A protein n=1 Tax=Georgenia yuyongxinii TaxID=2589797 RepID=UPI00143DA24B|nr:glycosyltransferase family A protein [Georgenia yuyongxinii]